MPDTQALTHDFPLKSYCSPKILLDTTAQVLTQFTRTTRRPSIRVDMFDAAAKDYQEALNKSGHV